jgi:hypothetical protein
MPTDVKTAKARTVAETGIIESDEQPTALTSTSNPTFGAVTRKCNG